MEVQLSRRSGIPPVRVHWGGIAIAIIAAVLLGGVSGAVGRHYLNASVARPLPGATRVQAQPVPTVGPGTDVTPAALPDHILIQVPFTTQAPLNNWSQHQESCEAANLTMLYEYWTNDSDVVINSTTADNMIRQIDAWKPQPDLNDSDPQQRTLPVARCHGPVQTSRRECTGETHHARSCISEACATNFAT